MTKVFLGLLLSLAGMMHIHNPIACAQELDLIQLLPSLDVDWQIEPDDQQREAEAKLPYRWRVFRNKTTGDLLSFATHPKLDGDRPLEYLSDTSLEIFPNGRAVWTQPPTNTTTNVVAIEVVDIGRKNASLNVLEYCFISESQDGDNLMAHGRAWVGPQGLVFAQHTSAKPITSDLVDQTMKSIIEDHKKLAATASP